MIVSMTPQRLVLGLSVLLSFAQTPSTGFRSDPPKACSSCDEWNGPHEPFRVFGNTYYVGVAGLTAILITSNTGLILLDGGLPQSAPLIDANIRKLGFRTEDVRLIVNSHAHYDHAGGIAALQRASGATVSASASSARAMALGGATPDDPQLGFGRDAMAFPPVKNAGIVPDGDVLRVGDLAITAHFTPAHTSGSTTWTWRSCEGERCLNVVYADSLSPVSAPGFRFTGDATHPSLVESFRKSIATIAELPCDIVLAPHPELADLDGKLKRREQQGATDAFIDANACRGYAANATKRLDARIAEEAAKK
jgi:metallo-beta-lactamase class B